jgi:hypothetical protein
MSKRSSGILDKLIVKIIKVFLLLLVTVAVIIGAYFGYLEYEKSQKLKAESQRLKAESQKLKAELSYRSDFEWSWHDEYKRIQIANNNSTGRNILRKVYMNREYVIYAYKNPDYSMSAAVSFDVSCEPSSKIITSQKFGSGKPKILECHTDGDTLAHSASWSVKGNNIIWEDNLDGFSFRVDFSDWDFTKLDQEITLEKAMSKIPAEQTNR